MQALMLHFSIYCKQQKLDRSYPPSFSLPFQHFRSSMSMWNEHASRTSGVASSFMQCAIFSEILLHVTLSQGITWTSVARIRPLQAQLEELEAAMIERAWLIRVRETS